MVRTTEEILNSLKSVIGENSDDTILSLLEDTSDTLNDLTEKAKEQDKENWKEKYEELDKSWREKYKARFFNPTEPEDDDFADEETSKPKTFEELFEVN